jgi:hypothetical protein
LCHPHEWQHEGSDDADKREAVAIDTRQIHGANDARKPCAETQGGWRVDCSQKAFVR